jgi:hypothetical protein
MYGGERMSPNVRYPTFGLGCFDKATGENSLKWLWFHRDKKLCFFCRIRSPTLVLRGFVVVKPTLKGLGHVG